MTALRKSADTRFKLLRMAGLAVAGAVWARAEVEVISAAIRPSAATEQDIGMGRTRTSAKGETTRCPLSPSLSTPALVDQRPLSQSTAPSAAATPEAIEACSR